MNKQKYVLYGAAQNALMIENEIRTNYPNYQLVGCIDDQKKEQNNYPLKLLGNSSILSGLKNQGIENIIVTISNPKIRVEKSKQLANRGFNIPSLYNEKLNSKYGVEIGKGDLIYKSNSTIINPNVKIKDYVAINSPNHIKASTIGEGTIIAPYGFIGVHAEIGKNCFIYPHVTILPEVKIGNNCVIGAGVVISKDVPNDTKVIQKNKNMTIRNN